MHYKVWIKLGWDKTYRRTFPTIAQCERWLNSYYQRYRPSQIIASAIVGPTNN